MKNNGRPEPNYAHLDAIDSADCSPGSNCIRCASSGDMLISSSSRCWFFFATTSTTQVVPTAPASSSSPAYLLGTDGIWQKRGSFRRLGRPEDYARLRRHRRTSSEFRGAGTLASFAVLTSTSSPVSSVITYSGPSLSSSSSLAAVIFLVTPSWNSTNIGADPFPFASVFTPATN